MSLQKKTKRKGKTETKKQKKSIKNKQIKIIEIKPEYTDDYMKTKEGDYFEEKHYDMVVDFDCDCYKIKNGKRILLFKFRKNVIPQKLCEIGMQNLKKLP